MSYKDRIRKLWGEIFEDSRDYMSMYFDRVYQEEDAMVVTSTDETLLSSLLLQQYPFLYQGQETSMGYIAGAMTRRNARGMGLMAGLIKKSFYKARERGDMLVSLIPAHDWLYFYYDKFNFSTVFYVDPQRFTSLHQFTSEGAFTVEPDIRHKDVYEAFHRFEVERGCGVLHTLRDFLNIIADNEADGGKIVALRNAEGEVASVAFAVVGASGVTVTALLGESEDAREAALAELRKQLPDLAFKVLAPPLEEHRRLYDRGMARIVDVEKCLRMAASANPKWKSTIRVCDPDITENSGVYKIADGKVTRLLYSDGFKMKLDLDLHIRVFNQVVFSAPHTGDIIGFPSLRPVMSLMLE